MSSPVELEGGGLKKCKSYQTRGRKGHCVNSWKRKGSRLVRTSRSMRGGDVEMQGGEVEGAVEGEIEGGEPCKRGKTRRGTGHCHKPKTRSRKSKTRSRKSHKKTRSRKSHKKTRSMRGGEMEMEGGEVQMEGGVVPCKPKCKKNKTRQGTGRCHTPKRA